MTPLCERCGSVLSIVTWTCVRGAYCRPARQTQTPSSAEIFEAPQVGGDRSRDAKS